MKYLQGRILFKSPKKSKDLIVINFKGNKFTVFKMKINEEESKIELCLTSEVLIQNSIDYFNINYHDFRVVIYSQRDDALVVIHLDKLT